MDRQENAPVPVQLLPVPYISQAPGYPTGCESVSAVMLLQFLGYDLSVDDFIRAALPCRPFETRGGEMWGADPRCAFCGSPYEEEGFGCYSPVICRALDAVFAKRAPAAHRAVDETGQSVAALCERYIDRGLPFLCWTCMDLRAPIVGPSWRLLDGGETFTWISNEHCLVVVGCDKDFFYCNDPYEGHGLVRVERVLMEARHAAQHSMAVGVQRLGEALR